MSGADRVVTIIDADEFLAAQKDPAVARFIADAEAYVAEGDNWPWVVEEPEDWRTRTSDDSRRLRRACAVYGGGLLVGLLLVRLALALSGALG